ncbi:MAG: hypothetical protein WKG00_20520 [Polyangiaceae bacterium]
MRAPAVPASSIPSADAAAASDGVAGEPAPPVDGAGATPPAAAAPLRVRLGAATHTLSAANRDTFQLDFVVINEGAAVVEPRLGESSLLVDGVVLPIWTVYIGNGARDERFAALPPGDRLDFSYAMGTALPRAPGKYVLVYVVRGARSAPFELRVTP